MKWDTTKKWLTSTIINERKITSAIKLNRNSRNTKKFTATPRTIKYCGINYCIFLFSISSCFFVIEETARRNSYNRRMKKATILTKNHQQPPLAATNYSFTRKKHPNWQATVRVTGFVFLFYLYLPVSSQYFSQFFVS